MTALSRAVLATAIVIGVAHSAAAETVDELAVRAKALLDAEKFAEAAEVYRQAASREPLVSKYHCNTAVAYYEADNFQLAMVYMDRCWRADTRAFRRHVEVWEYLKKQNSWDNELSIYELSPTVNGKFHDDVIIRTDRYAEHGPDRTAAMYLLPEGPYRIRIELEGYETVVLKGNMKKAQWYRWSQELTKLEPDPEPVSVPDLRLTDSDTALATPTRSRKAPWIALGVSASAGIGGAIIGQTGGTDRTADHLEFALYGAAVTAAAFAVYLWWQR